MTRAQLSAIVRLLAGIGLFLLMLAFLRACFSPPQLPMPPTGGDKESSLHSGSLPPRY